MRVRLIQHSFYIIVSEEAEFEVEKLRKCYGELKKGPKLFMEGAQGGGQRVFPGEEGGTVRKRCQDGEHMYHEEHVVPDPMVKSRT